jgi:hypothetical protein
MQFTRHQLALAGTYFFLTAAPGFWIPVLSRIMEEKSWGSWIVWAYALPPLASLLSPLVVSAQADQRYSAEKVVGVMLLSGAVFQFFAFRELGIGQRPWLFLLLLGLNSLITAPAFGLLNTITLVYLRGTSEKFGYYRMWGSFGWVAAGWLVSALSIDSSPTTGYLSVIVRVIAFGCCCFLPRTPPAAFSTLTLRQKLGLGSLGLLRRRDLGTVIITGTCFMVPLSAYYMHTSLFMSDLGFERIAATMTIGQMTEVLALFSLGYLVARISARTLFLTGIAFGIIRYGLFATGAMTDSGWMVVLGIALHGLCWTLFFEAARPFVHQRAPAELRAQVQALLTLGTGGIGSITGTLFVGYLFDRYVGSAETGWTTYWFVLMAICIACFLGFAIRFRDKKD